MMPSDAYAALGPVVAKFQELGVAYYIGGSVVSSMVGIPRATLDVDIVADLAPKHVAPLVDGLKAAYYVNAATVQDAIARRSCFNLIHLSTSFKVDIFVLKNRPYDRAALVRIRSRLVDAENSKLELCLASPEDIILAKLEWYRLGDEVSDRQWRDVIGVMKVVGASLDRPYMNRWAAELGVADLLEKAWQEAEADNP